MRAAQRLGKQLQRLRTTRGLTQEQLAVNVGLSRTFVMRLELGQYDPTLSTLVRLAKVLRVSVAELLGESMSASIWWQVGEQRFAMREEAEGHARATSGDHWLFGVDACGLEQRCQFAFGLHCSICIQQ